MLNAAMVNASRAGASPEGDLESAPGCRTSVWISNRRQWISSRESPASICHVPGPHPETMSEPHKQLPEAPNDLKQQVARLIEQSKRNQTEATRIQQDLQRIQIELAAIGAEKQV